MAGFTFPRYHILFFAAVLVPLLAGCAAIPTPARSPHLGEAGPAGGCASFFASLDKQVVDAEVLDAGTFRVQGYPYLRVDRFLASFRDEVEEEPAFNAWVNRMQALDLAARTNEVANLPRTAKLYLSSPEVTTAGIDARVAACGDVLKNADFQDERQRDILRKRAVAPDEYLELWQALGLYPVTRVFMAEGVSRWHEQARGRFSAQAPTGWQSIRYDPMTAGDPPDAGRLVAQAVRDAIGIPVYTPAVREALFEKHAPVWEIEAGNNDSNHIGAPLWSNRNGMAVDTLQPVTYTLLSFTRFEKQILTQLNYMVWFPSRPKDHALDWYGGLLDGVNYRVTLDADGEPLLYETVHHCGCYYAAYPTDKLSARTESAYAEPPLILQAPRLIPATERMVVAMESRTHQVRHVYPIQRRLQHLPQRALPYTLKPYSDLLSLPTDDGGRRSMFGPNSLAPGSERLERLFLWPSGVLSPGAMRQWGRHAVAFAGRRHFDDPFALEKMFTGPGTRMTRK